MKSKLIVSIVVLLAFSLSSCVSTEVAGLWKSEGTVVSPAQKIMVVGIFKEDEIRKGIEQSLVADLNDRGSKAFPSYKVFESEKLVDDSYVAAKLKEVKADTVVVVRAIDRDQVGNYIPGEIYDNPPDYYQHLSTYSQEAQKKVVRVEYASPLDRRSKNMKHEQFTTETNVYDSSGKLVFTFATDTFTSYRNGRVIENLAEAIAEKLAVENVVGK